MTGSPPPTRLLLVRHGESTWNAARRWQGRADPPLTELGEQQASAAGATLAGGAGVATEPIGRVVSSTLHRARRTAELIAGRLGIEPGEALVDLAERSAGDWEGLTRAEIEDRYPGYLERGDRPPGYEPDDDVVRRASSALLHLVAHPAQTPQARSGSSPATTGSFLVVTHGGVVNALERHADEAWVRLGNLEGRWFEVDPSAGSVVPVGERVRLIETDGDAAPAPLGPGYA